MEDKEIFDTVILGNNGILWTRDLNEKDEVEKMLDRIGCVYMFVGHTVVERVKIINERIWYTDTGISRAFGNDCFQYIDIFKNQVSIRDIKN